MEVSISEKRLLLVKEAAAVFSLGVKTIRRMAEEHEGEFSVFIGNRWLISPGRFEEYLFSLKKQETGALMESIDE